MSEPPSTIMAWEKDPPHLQPSKGYLRVRRVNRAILETWFREISTVDIDTFLKKEASSTPLGIQAD